MSSSNQYSCHLICFPEVETKVLTLMVKFARERNLIVVGMQSRNIDSRVKSGEMQVEINANFESQDTQVKLEDLEELLSLLKKEANVTSISWQLLSVNT